MTTENYYAVWQAAKRGTAADPQNDQAICGFWRIASAKTKPDTPVAIWPVGDQQVAKIGRRDPVTEGSKDWHDFIGWGWTKCVPVEKAEYDAAIANGEWADGKSSRQQSDEERLGVAAGEGDNAPPADELIEDQIKAAVESAQAITKVTSADEARKANELAERLQGLYRLGDAQRDKEKRPHDDAAKAVQARWLPIITPAETERKRLIAVAKEWIKTEEARLAREAEAERRKKQAAIDAENERIREANRKAAADAEARRIEQLGNAPIGSEPEPEPEPELEQEIAPAKVEVPKVQAASTFGRATGLRKVTRGTITDMAALAAALVAIKHPELVELLQKLADRAAKAGVPLAGMEITETRE